MTALKHNRRSLSRVRSTAYGGKLLTDFPGYAIPYMATGNILYPLSFGARGSAPQNPIGSTWPDVTFPVRPVFLAW
ncbi:hypothetical protein [Oxobacter pfennigii]|uniref:hypothetical protein n=1 Tax=Oxobacter pfennigii TaxID=36849 RepID=UPI0013648B91|nr:hypothetical protein [Oxobacter pfennigii]